MRRYIEWVIRNRILVICVTFLVTIFFGYRLSALRVVVDTKRMEPWNHPYTRTSAEIERVFGLDKVVVIGITSKQGDVYQPRVLDKVKRINDAIALVPGAISANILSLAAPKAKSVIGTDDGMVVRRLMEAVPRSEKDLERLKHEVRAMPVYRDAIVSADERTTAIIAQFKDPEGMEGFQGLINKVQPIVDRERDDSVEIFIGGQPSYLAMLELYSQRIGFFFILAVVITGLIHYEAFRTAQGLILPLVTALVAVVWALGAMSVAGVSLDVFNASTPILILAVSAGHAVQILKRYYEEYNRLLAAGEAATPEVNRRAVATSVARIAPVMLTAGVVAALGFLSLLVFELPSIRTFGVFTAFGILSALALEMTFIPALRAALSPPKLREQHREKERRFWDRVAAALAELAIDPRRRRLVYMATLAVVSVCAVGTQFIRNDSNLRNLFFQDNPVTVADRTLNARLGGTNSLDVMIKGKGQDALKDPEVLRAMEATQRFLEAQPGVGKTLSIADFVKSMNRSMHGNDPAYETIPDSRDAVSQYLLLYSMSGEPGDFDSYVDNDYRNADISVLLKVDSTAYFDTLAAKLHPFVAQHFGERAEVQLGGSVARTTALNEVMVNGKLRNILQIGGVILFLCALVFRSFVAGVLVLVPMLITTLVNFGILGLAGIPLNIPNAITTAMGVGIGADYAIYMIYRLREELANGSDEETAIRTVFATAGKAVLFVACAVAGGYGVLVFSWGFYVHIWMGLLIASAMLTSSFTALTVLPSLILTLRPRFIFGISSPRAKPVLAVTIALLVSVLGISSHASADDLSPTQIMDKNFVALKVAGSTQNVTVELVNAQGQKRLRTTFSAAKLQANGVDYTRMVRYLEPSDVRGTATLLVEHAASDDDIWIYLPALKKTRRLVSSNKKDSFVGTDFSYGDVIGHRVNEWRHRLVKVESVDGASCYVIESLPKNDDVASSSGYSKRESWIRQDNFVMVKAEMWDLSGQLLKSMHFSDVRLVSPNGKWQPMVQEATNLKTGHKTVLRFSNFKLEPSISDEVFTTRALEREP